MAAQAPPGAGQQVAKRTRKPRADKFSYDARLVLGMVWAACGGQCGKCLAASIKTQLDALERHGELAADGRGRLDREGRYSPSVRAELLAMSAAAIYRYLASARPRGPVRRVSTTRPTPLLRSAIGTERRGRGRGRAGVRRVRHRGALRDGDHTQRVIAGRTAIESTRS